MDAVVVHDYDVWSAFFYFVLTRSPFLQLDVAGSCQRRLVFEDSLVNGKLRFGCHPCVIIPFVLRLLHTQSRVCFLSQCVDSML